MNHFIEQQGKKVVISIGGRVNQAFFPTIQAASLAKQLMIETISSVDKNIDKEHVETQKKIDNLKRGTRELAERYNRDIRGQV